MRKIAIHSVPRSGSTWLGSIFDSSPNVAYRYQPLFSYGHKSQLNEYSVINEINKFYIDILNTKDRFVLQKEAIAKGIVPEFKKEKISHIVYKEVRYHNIVENLLKEDDEIKIIGLVRNPLAVINSWLNAPKEFKKHLGWKEMEEWRFAPKKNDNRKEEFNGFEKWKEVTELFEKLKDNYPENFYLLKYNDLLENTLQEVSKVFSFCSLELAKQTTNFIEKSSSIDKSKDAYSVYRVKEKDDRWKEELDENIRTEVEKDLENTELFKYL